MKKCSQCKAPLPQRGELRTDIEGLYVLRVCSCGRLHKTRFSKLKQPARARVIEWRTWGYLIYVAPLPGIVSA